MVHGDRNAELVSTLAAALARYCKSPGEGAGWVDPILRSLERERPAQYARLSRACALATTLAGLAGLKDDEEAAVTVGLFLHGVLAEVATEAGQEKRRGFKFRKKPHDWIEYLQNASWLAPALEIKDGVQRDDDEETSMAATVAQMAFRLVRDDLSTNRDPPDLLARLESESTSPNWAHLLQLLWSEEGQKVYHRHFVGQDWNRLASGDIEGKIQLLASSTAWRTIADRWHEANAESAAITDSDNFEQRKRALRLKVAGRTDAPTENSGAQGAFTEVQPNSVDNVPAEVHGTSDLPRFESVLRPTSPLLDDGSNSETAEHIAKSEDSEVSMQTAGRAAATAESDAFKISQSLEELRIRFSEIERMSAEGQALLAGLAPQLEEFSAMLREMEGFMHRWTNKAA